MKSISAWKRLRDHPPAIVRLYARRKVSGKHVRALAMQEIAIASGIPMMRLAEIVDSKTWNNITIGEAERFCVACNFDPLNPRDRNRQSAYERACKNRKNRLAFLRDSPWWETETIPLIAKVKRDRMAV